MRRVLIGAVAGAALALATAAGVSAYWVAQVRTAPAALTAGDLNIAAQWTGGAQWPTIGPSQTAMKHVRVTVSHRGATLSSQLFVTTTVAKGMGPYVTIRHNLDDCTGSPGPVVPTFGYPGTGSLTDGQVIDVCVRISLAAAAPATLQGQDLAPTVSIRVEQRRSP